MKTSAVDASHFRPSRLALSIVVAAVQFQACTAQPRPNGATSPASKESKMQSPPNPKDRPVIPEMLGASDAPFHLRTGVTHRSFEVRPPAGPARLRPDLTPRQFYLRVEGMTSQEPAPTFDVYINVPDGDPPEKHPGLFVKSMPLFGLVESSVPGGDHPDNGLSFRVDMTKLLLGLEAAKRWDAKSLRVSFVARPWDIDVDVKVARVSLYIE